jgi:protein-S-isoprenylcysteine O-methyltransferase Ste14
MMFLRMAVPSAAMVALLSLCAGRWDVWNFWAWVGVMWLTGSITYTVLLRVNPGLVAERLKPPDDRDRATRRLVALPFLSHLVLAGLDARYGWSHVPLALVIVGLVLEALGFGLVAWTLLSNPFASSAVRIQNEREHRVISSGPYALVRHPMYLAVFLVCLGGGPAVGSWFAWLTLLPIIAIFVRRTLLEDSMLQKELPGYPEYSARVRWRLIPFVL